MGRIVDDVEDVHGDDRRQTMSAVPSGYQDDAERIDREYIPDDATTEEEVEAALRDAGFPDASIESGDAQTGIGDWIATESDAWETVGPQVQDSGSVRRALDQQTGGVVSDDRAERIAGEVAGEIQSARAEAAQRIGDDGNIRTEDGQIIGTPSSVEEEVRDDGIYYRNSNTGTTGRAARFDK